VRLRVPALLTVAMATIMGLEGRDAAQQVAFRSSVDLVSVDVAVKDGNRPVDGLSSADFELADNGVRQTIDAIGIETMPIDLMLVVDTSNSAAKTLERLKADIQAIANLLRHDDRLELVTFDRTVRALLPLQRPNRQLPLDLIRPVGGTALNDAVLYALAWPAEVSRRHLIITLTDGEDTTSATADEVVPLVARRSEAVLDVVLFAPAVPEGMEPHPPYASRTTLVEAASATGGEVYQLDDAVKASRLMFDEFRRSYVLRYALRGVSREGWHSLAVRVARTGGERFTIRARRGYFGGE
jgi:VWFA-related protein